MFEWAARCAAGVCRASCLAVLVCAALGLAGCSEPALFRMANLPAHFSRVGVRRDLPYGGQARQTLDIYALPGARDRPVVVFWYGGAWSTGDKDDYRFVGTTLAQHGYVAVLPDYRLYPQVRFPDFVDDGAAAVAWVQQHVREFGGDPNRIVLMGHSAGAHLAALLALDPSYFQRAGVQRAGIVGLVGLSGPYALMPDDEELNQIFAAPYTPADWQPLQHASADAPPTLLLHGLEDRRVASVQSQQLFDALKGLGVPVELQLYAGFGHARTIAGFTPLARPLTPTLARCLQFLERVTAQPAPAALAASARVE